MNKQRIIIVDDEPDILDLLEKALNIEGFFNITKLENGLTAVDTCKQIFPDIIILDVMLPDIDGYEVCKQIRQISHCPILFLSSKNDEVDKILGLAVGGDDYVTKPFSPKEVAFRVKAQLRRAEYKQNAVQDESIKIGTLTIDPNGCMVLVYNCRQKKLNSLYYQVKEQRRYGSSSAGSSENTDRPNPRKNETIGSANTSSRSAFLRCTPAFLLYATKVWKCSHFGAIIILDFYIHWEKE